MHPKRYARWSLLGALALVLMVGGSVKAQPVDRSGSVIVPVGGAVRLQMKSKKPIKQVFVEKPNILLVEADAANPAYVILKGLQQGTSHVELTDVDGAKETYEVVVQTDIDLLRNVLKRAVPTASVEVIPFGGGVILSGFVARAEDIDPIIRITSSVLGIGMINIVNALTVGGVQQVQLDVIVARVDRTKLRQRGFSFILNGSTASGGSLIGGLASSTGTTGNSTTTAGVGMIPGAASALPTGQANLVFGVIPAQFQSLLQALKTESLAKIVAEPKLVTQSGRPASFLSGGQQATLSAASGVNGPGVTYVPFGTQLSFLPIVYGNGKIYLEVAPSVTAVDSGLGITTSFGAVPGFTAQNITTSIVLEPGQTFAIGGLIQTTVQASAARVPLLGEIPFLAPFFSSQSFTEEESELVVLVTPHLVDPMDHNQLPKRLPSLETRAPDDFELYLEGLQEAPRGQRNVFENKHYKGAWKNSPTAQTFPCGAKSAYNGSCANGNCAPGAAAKQPVVLNVAPPAEMLPPAASVPNPMTDSAAPPSGR